MEAKINKDGGFITPEKYQKRIETIINTTKIIEGPSRPVPPYDPNDKRTYDEKLYDCMKERGLV